jgi:hypothetical protein
MIKKVLAIFALAVMALTTMPTPDAEARRGGGGGFRGGGIKASGFRAGPAFRPAFRAAPRVIVRPIYRRPIVSRIYTPVVIGGTRCTWLRQRALVTGSPYWWRRYRLCLRGY